MHLNMTLKLLAHNYQVKVGYTTQLSCIEIYHKV
jgi:hypothetical protein